MRANIEVFTQAEMDALVAAALEAVRNAAIRKAQDIRHALIDGGSHDFSHPDWDDLDAVVAAILVPADAQKALREHDTALRAEAVQTDVLAYQHALAEKATEIFNLNTRKAKLEAENAGLRESLEWAVYALEHGSSVEVHWLKYVAKAQHDKARALLAKSV